MNSVMTTAGNGTDKSLSLSQGTADTLFFSLASARRRRGLGRGGAKAGFGRSLRRADN
jgi:hypothetical protein